MNHLILGQRRQGKSTLALAVAGMHSKTIVIFDPNWNYRMDGVLTIKSPSHLREVLADPENADKVMVVRIGPFDSADIDIAFSNYAQVLFEFEEYAVIVDESHMLQNRSRINNELDRFLRRSPASVHVIQTGHRYMELNGLSRYLVDEMRLFRNEQAREVDLIEEQQPGVDAAVLRRLGDRHYVRWYRDSVGNPYAHIQPDSESWFIDLRNPNQRHSEGASGSDE